MEVRNFDIIWCQESFFRGHMHASTKNENDSVRFLNEVGQRKVLQSQIEAKTISQVVTSMSVLGPKRESRK